MVLELFLLAKTNPQSAGKKVLYPQRIRVEVNEKMSQAQDDSCEDKQWEIEKLSQL